MEISELEARLAAMEQSAAEQAMAAEQKGFIDKYGTMFSGDEGIGMAILAEMNRRGVPSAAVGADRVVQEILDTIRQEATAVLDKIKMDQQTVGNLMDQVQEIQEAVDAAVGGETAGNNGVGELPPEVAAMDPMAGDMPPPMEGGDMPPPPMEGTPIAGDMGPGAPIPEAEAPLPPPPNQVTSDVRAKKILKPKQFSLKPKGFKPPAHLLSAIAGGM